MNDFMLSREIRAKYRALREHMDATGRYLPTESLEEGAVYWLTCRNAQVGIWHHAKQGFVIPRWKFDRAILFVEYHWDATNLQINEAGTAKPYEWIEASGVDLQRLKVHWENGTDDLYRSTLAYLLEKDETYTYEALLLKYGTTAAE